jgi:hypothetical protein
MTPSSCHVLRNEEYGKNDVLAAPKAGSRQILETGWAAVAR